ncbi:hypothetical protein BDV95DRAFT_605558 [Massariosphaeria phaeospora]|uniref:Uncharacterized protein n=1 Tax=Massariosphaeria phaeospora TaxID=100035 RepID=A0A7C8ICU8_9PLEO|nr:hypothetical protein BDV95DRAFT_605558 [Massariosphaeria phaeospora]
MSNQSEPTRCNSPGFVPTTSGSPNDTEPVWTVKIIEQVGNVVTPLKDEPNQPWIVKYFTPEERRQRKAQGLAPFFEAERTNYDGHELIECIVHDWSMVPSFSSTLVLPNALHGHGVMPGGDPNTNSYAPIRSIVSLGLGSIRQKYRTKKVWVRHATAMEISKELSKWRALDGLIFQDAGYVQEDEKCWESLVSDRHENLTRHPAKFVRGAEGWKAIDGNTLIYALMEDQLWREMMGAYLHEKNIYPAGIICYDRLRGGRNGVWHSGFDKDFDARYEETNVIITGGYFLYRRKLHGYTLGVR